MKIDRQKFEMALANSCMTLGDLSKRSGISTFTITRLRSCVETKPVTVGKIAKALGVSVEELIEHDAATSDQSNKPGFKVEE